MVELSFNSSIKANAETVTKKNKVQKVVFVPPKDAKPKHTTGGASRRNNKCPQDVAQINLELTAVIPTQDKILTSKAVPTFLVYLPQTSAQKAFFSIREVGADGDNQNSHYQSFIPLTQNSGVFRLTLPKDAPALQEGKSYQWSFALICDRLLKPDSPTVAGTVTRVSLNQGTSQKLETATLLEKAVIYGEQGFWYDSIASVAEVYSSEPNNRELANIWSNLLDSDFVQLEEIVNQPIVN